MKMQEHGANKLAKELKKQLDIMENKFKAQELENSKIIRQKEELEKSLAKEQQNSAALGSTLDKCLNDLKSSTEREYSMHERFKHLELMQGKITTQLVNKVKLCKSLYRPCSEDEYSSQSDNDYAHSEEDFKEEEESQDSLQRAWKYASEYSDPEDEDEQQAPGDHFPLQQDLSFQNTCQILLLQRDLAPGEFLHRSRISLEEQENALVLKQFPLLQKLDLAGLKSLHLQDLIISLLTIFIWEVSL